MDGGPGLVGRIAGIVREYAPFIGHHPGEIEARSVDDGLREVDCRLPRFHAVQSEPCVDVDGHVERDAVGGRGIGQVGHVVGTVDSDADPGLAREGAQARDLLRSHDEVGNEHVSEAVGNEDLGLSDARHGNPADVTARRQLLVRDRGRPVGLDMRPELGRLALEERRDRRDVVVERPHVNDERRRIELLRRGPNGLEDRSFHSALLIVCRQWENSIPECASLSGRGRPDGIIRVESDAALR